MKLYIVSFILTVLIVGNVAYGQGYTFKVLANKGENKVKSGEEWQPMKTGASLKQGDEIAVAENGYMGLVHANGKTLEIKKTGNYKIAELSGKLTDGGSSLASKYADFVLSKMSPEGKKNRLSVTGAVDRGESKEIQLMMPSSVQVYNENALIKWDAPQDASKFVVTLKNMFDDTLLTIETDQPNVQLDLSGDKIANENVILISVSGMEGKETSKTYAIKRLRPEEAEKVKATLSELTAETDQKTAVNSVILAGFYEENNLLIDALSSYEQAIALAPEVETYQEAYTDFILRNHLND